MQERSKQVLTPPKLRADLAMPEGMPTAELTHVIPADGVVELIHTWPDRPGVARLFIHDDANAADLGYLRELLEERGVKVDFKVLQQSAPLPA